jgi:hypothetical protein
MMVIIFMWFPSGVNNTNYETVRNLCEIHIAFSKNKIESGNLEIEKNCGNSFSVDRKKL